MNAFTLFVILLVLYLSLGYTIQKHSPGICAWDNGQCDQKCGVVSYLRKMKEQYGIEMSHKKCPWFSEKESKTENGRKRN